MCKGNAIPLNDTGCNVFRQSDFCVIKSEGLFKIAHRVYTEVNINSLRKELYYAYYCKHKRYCVKNAKKLEQCNKHS